MKFRFLTGDVNYREYGGKWISRKLNNGDFDYWIVLELINWYDAVGEREAPAKYNVSLSAVSPQEAGEGNIRKAFDCCGLDYSEYENNNLAIVESLHSYGVYSPLWGEDGNNCGELLKKARRQADLASGLFGFFMDAPKNGIGSTGWDLIKGDLMAGLNR